MEKYIPEVVYENLVKLFTYRKCVLTTAPLSREQLVQMLNQHEHVALEGERAATDMHAGAIVRVVLIAPNSKYSAKTSEFKKLLRALVKDARMYEVVIVSEYRLTTHILKALADWRTAHANVLIEDYDYGMFACEKPLHSAVPRHTIATRAEVDKWCREHYTIPERLKRIVSSDAQAVWIGLRPGMVCKIERTSETAGSAVDYRYCVR